MSDYNILFLGDVVGRPGLRPMQEGLRKQLYASLFALLLMA